MEVDAHNVGIRSKDVWGFIMPDRTRAEDKKVAVSKAAKHPAARNVETRVPEWAQDIDLSPVFSSNLR